MSEESDFLKKLVESVADGDAVDWQALDEVALDDKLRRLVAHLRLVSEIAEVHRSRVDDVADTPEPLTRPDPLVPAPPAPPHGAPPNGNPPAPPPGDTPAPRPSGDERWGHLLLMRKIGEGAFGEVFLAHDPWLDHAVALKRLKQDVSGALQTKILHEARKLARVRHNNVVTVHGADRHNGRIGFWMEFVDGRTLSDWLGEGRLSAGEAAHVGQEVCRALAAVHQAGIVHRDVKAQNVMRAAQDGRIILMDFGAGEFIGDPLLAFGEGTPLYLAPEVLEGRPASVQSDIYATGVLLYHLVTRRYPVVGASVPDLKEAHRAGRRTHLSDERSDLPHGFIAAVERALDADPARRYASAGQMYAALGGLGTSTVPSQPTDRTDGVESLPPPKPVPWWKKWAAGFAAAFGAVFVMGFVASRALEVALHVDPAFGAGPLEYLVVGAQAVPPLVLFWAVAALGGLALMGIRLAFRRQWDRLAAWLLTPVDAVDPAIVAGAVFAAAAGALALVTWAFYPIFDAMMALQETTPGRPVDLTALGPAAHDLHGAHSAYSAYLSFLAALAVWRLFPRLEARAADAGTVRIMKWATAAVALLAVIASSSPRRLIWERFEVVLFDKQPSVVLGRSADELLLYAPERALRRSQRVKSTAPTLEYTGIRRLIFEDHTPVE